MKRYLASLALLLLVFSCKQKTASEQDDNSSNDKKWWKEAVVYQLYPRSFKDSDGDGIGDLKGIISKLDYIKSLGVDVIWLNPIYASPNDDNGYDISDYRNIMREFGTMADFDSLLKGMHDRQMKLVMDLVVNHSSDEHDWFKQSRSSRDNPYRNYYHWWNEERGKPNPRYSLFDVNHDAWRYDSLTKSYYLHYFSRKQPDLNWENPQVRKEVFDIMKFWADKGIDGFRLDAFQFAAKDTTFPKWPDGYEKDFMKYYAMGPNLHEYLQEMDSAVFEKYNVMSVAEGAGNTMKDAHDLVDADRHELNMAYAFDAVDIARQEGYSLLHFKEVFSKWDSAFANKGWLSVFLSNHDQARLVSRFGNDKPEYREASAKMLATFVLTMRGTPFWYNGDELGMSNAGFTDIKEYRDVATLNEYAFQQKNGADMNAYMQKIAFGSRDNGRTPFQWNTTTNAGFTTGIPWIGVNKNYTTINADQQEKDSSSVLNYFRAAVKMRKANPTLVYGKYTLIDKANPDVYAYTREDKDGKFLVLLNFSKTDGHVSFDDKIKTKGLVLSNKADGLKSIEGSVANLQPYEAIVFKL